MPITRQRVAIHVPAEIYCGTIGRQFLENGAVNTPHKLLKDGVFRGVHREVIYRGIPGEQWVQERQKNENAN
jgi:hypothetical protein